MHRLLALLIVLAPELAVADDSGLGDVAVGINVPTSWLIGSVGASVYVGLTEHQAVRANAAHFRIDTSLSPAFPLLEPAGGSLYDVGLGWVWYERGLQDGWMIELGVNRRQRDTEHWPEMSPRTEINTTAYSARLLIGWSWRLGRRWFIAAAIGGSVGRESGVETFTADRGPLEPPVTSAVQRVRTDIETSVRWGIDFGD